MTTDIEQDNKMESDNIRGSVNKVESHNKDARKPINLFSRLISKLKNFNFDKKNDTVSVKGSIIFAIAFIICLMLVNLLYYQIVITNKQIYREDKEFQMRLEENKSFDYIFIGASVMQVGINPEYVPRSFNLGYYSESYRENYFRLRAALEDGMKLKYVVIEQDLVSFSEYILGGQRDSQMLYDLWYYSKITDFEEQKKATDKNVAQLIILRNFPIIGRAYDFSFILKEKTVMKDGWSENNINYSTTDMDAQGYRRVRGQFYGWNRIDPELEIYYVKLIKLAQENNITVVLIRMPMAESYEKHLKTFNVSKEYYYSHIDNLTINAIGNYHILDYHSLYFNNSDYFADADHLNSHGAAALSKKVYLDLQNIEKNKKIN